MRYRDRSDGPFSHSNFIFYSLFLFKFLATILTLPLQFHTESIFCWHTSREVSLLTTEMTTTGLFEIQRHRIASNPKMNVNRLYRAFKEHALSQDKVLKHYVSKMFLATRSATGSFEASSTPADCAACKLLPCIFQRKIDIGKMACYLCKDVRILLLFWNGIGR